MDKTEVLGKLTPIFRSIFRNENLVLSNELSANDVDRWDSLSHMLLITEVEQRLSFKFKLKELNRMRNVGDMVDIIVSKF